MRPILTLLTLWLCCLAPAQAIDEADLLPVDTAFAIQASALDAHTVRISWDIAEGYYLYRGRISFIPKTEGIEFGEPIMPDGEQHEDEFFGRVETYRHHIDVDLPVLGTPAGGVLEIEARSQGCADLGVCYPPHRQPVTVTLPSSAANLSDVLSPSGGAALADPASSLSLAADPAGNPGPLSFGGGSGLVDEVPLPQEQAFVFETIALGSTELLTRWTIAEGYYIYRDQIAFQVTPGAPVRLGEPLLPPGEPKTDDHFGEVMIYRGQIEVSLPIERLDRATGSFNLTGHYRGCKDESICYPPIVSTLNVDLPAHDGALGAAGGATRVGAIGVIDAPPEAGLGLVPGEKPQVAPVDIDIKMIPEQDRLAQALGEDTLWTLLSFFGFGLLLAFTPCVFPMVPILSGIIAGQGKDITTGKAFTLSLVYVLAMAVTYTFAGVIAGLFGENLQAAFQNAWVLGSFSLVFVLLALSMFGFYELQLPSALQTRLNQLSNRQEGGTLAGVAIMGFLSALIVGPCVAPPLAAALIYIGQSGDAWLGGSALFALSMGMGAPLILIGTGAGKYLPRAGAWMDAVKAVFGVALLGLALWMLERIADPTLILFGWAMLLAGSGVYLGALERLPEGASGWRKLWKSLGVMLLIIAVLEFVGAASGGKDWLQPLKGLGQGSQTSAGTEAVVFQRIKSLEDLDAIVTTSGQPAMLDFYADWCVDCKRMDKYSFPEPPVQQALRAGLALKADVTANDDIDQALMKRFRIIGPPAILFFDAHGREMPQFRVIGYQKPEAFAKHVNLAFEVGSAKQP
jgi:thiol:disulfide interchange protein DsbD